MPGRSIRRLPASCSWAWGQRRAFPRYLTGHDKGYDARIVFGASTDTDDAQGCVLASADDAELARVMRTADAQAVLDEFTGRLEPLPPAYSAIKKNGVVAYKAAREGSCIDLEPRPVTVHAARLVTTGVQDVELVRPDGDPFARVLPYWDVHFHVSKGTYIRALARDIGAYLGCGAHLGSLRRTCVADTGVDEAWCSIDELSTCMEREACFPGVIRRSSWAFPSSSSASSRSSAWKTDASWWGSTHARAWCRASATIACSRSTATMTGVIRPATVIPGGVIGVG